jgi:ABC-type branched-subunit amino acid transport system substrate-binding protein
MTNTRTNARRPWWLAIVIAGALLASLLFLACSSDKKDGGSTPSATSASPSTTGASPTSDGTPQVSGDILTQEEVLKKDPSVTKHVELKWGAMFEQSGPLAGFGEPSLDGLKLAVKEINDAGGFQVGDTIYTVNLLVHDTKSTTQDALAVATELVRDDHVKIIWGPASVGDPEATTITQREKVLHICPCPQRELTALSSQDKADQNKWAFQTLSAPSKFLPGGAKNTKKEHPEFTSFATICVSSQTGRAFCKFFTDAYEAAGFKHVGEVFFQDGTTDFRPFLTTFTSKHPDIILNFTDAGVDQFQLIHDSVALDVGKFYIAVALQYDLFEALVGGAAVRDKIVAAGAAPRNNAIYTSEKARIFFDEKYKPFKGGTLPFAAFAAMLTYDPAYMLVAAMQKAGTVDDTTKIAAALKQIHYSGYGEDDMYFNKRNIIVTGNDACNLYHGNMTCSHFPPAPQ